MNNAELERLLKSVQPPARPEGYWEEFPQRVTTRLRRGRSDSAESRGFRFWVLGFRWPRLAWGLGLAALCLVIGFSLGRWRQNEEATVAASSSLLQNSKVIQEVMMLFPNRVRAVVQEGDSFSVLLAEEANVPASTPLWVKICHGDKCVALVTFSGQELEVAGQQLTVLASAEGGVIVLGDRFAWASDGRKGGLKDLRIQARALEFASIR
jgi:hypothetical protein